MTRATYLRLLCAVPATVLLSALLFSLLYFQDNKYNTGTPQPRNGILLLEQDTLEETPVLFLVNGWEIYSGLLTPEQLHADSLRSGKTVFIGQYTGFDFGDAAQSRHGSATLVLNIAAPETARSYMLELPEIYSAYKLYVNGELLCQMGNPEPDSYTPRTGNRAVMFTASGNIELVLAMHDTSYIYSGLVYPPAFGEPSAVQKLLNIRLIIRAGCAALALFLGIFYLVTGTSAGRFIRQGGVRWSREAILYGLLCLCFLCYTGYPVFKAVGFENPGWYALEQLGYCAMLLIITTLQNRLCGYTGRAATAAPVIGAAMAALTLIMPAVAKNNSPLLYTWSWMMSVYIMLCALSLTLAAVYGLRRGRIQSPVMLCGALVFDTALVMDRIFPDYEPIYTGWFIEWAGLALVMLTGVVVGADIVEQYRQRRAMERNLDGMRQMMEAQQAYYPLVLEQAEQARAARHDLRHHLTAVREYVSQGNYDGLGDYLGIYDSVAEPQAVIFCGHPALNMLLSNFTAQAREQNVSLHAYADVPDRMPYADPDLFAVCANLLENALEAVRALPEAERQINAAIRMVPGSLVIAVDNAFNGEIEEQGGTLISSKRTGRQAGIGTASVRRIAQSYGGNAFYHWNQSGQGWTFHAEIILPEGGGEQC